MPEHAHGSDQLIYASRGVMEVHSGQSMWVIPPTLAIWVPAHTLHRIRMPAAVGMRTLYVRPGVIKRSHARCAVLSVTPLLKELVLEAVRLAQLHARHLEHRALRHLLAAHVTRASEVPTEITLPKEARALKAALRILEQLPRAPTLSNVCSETGLSTRTLQRLFQQEVGMDADTWRQQARLTKAVGLLLAGASVKEVASAVGYMQVSAFVAAFRRTFGETPRAWAKRMSVNEVQGTA